MALHIRTHEQRTESLHELARGVLVALALIGLMLAATVALNAQPGDRSYESAPDPAGIEIPF